MPASALVVDDHLGFGEADSALVRVMGAGFVGTAEGRQPSVQYLRKTPVGLALVDLCLAGNDGVEAAQRIALVGGASTIVPGPNRRDAAKGPTVPSSTAAVVLTPCDSTPACIPGLVP